jgi:hypothetical protein
MSELDIFSKINDILAKSTPDNFPIIKEEILKRENEKRNALNWMSSKWLRVAAIACLLFILGGSVTVAADKLIGTDFFHLFSLHETSHNTDNQVYMGFDQYEELSSSTFGTVVDTDEIAIEVLGAVSSGNAATVILRVTAKQLDSVLINNGILPQGNYCFNDTTGGSLYDDFQDASYRYYYSVEDEDLRSNQFNILYTVIKKEVITGKEYTIELKRFGYFSKGGFVTLYNKNWDISINFDTQADYTKTANLDKEILVDNKYVTIKQMSITPFSCIIDIQGRIQEDTEFSNILRKLDELNDELTVSFNNNAILDNRAFTHYATGSRADKDGNINQEGMVYYHLAIMFDKPILVNNVDAVYFNGEKYNLQ